MVPSSKIVVTWPMCRCPYPASYAAGHGGVLPEKEQKTCLLSSKLQPQWLKTRKWTWQVFTPKKWGRTVNKKGNYDDSHLPLSITDVGKVPDCILSHRVFLHKVMMPVKLWHHFETKLLRVQRKRD